MPASVALLAFGATGLGSVEPAIIGRRLAGCRPVLGIGVGYQVLFERALGPDGETPGCGEWPGTVETFAGADVAVPGWRDVDEAPESEMLTGVQGASFYFEDSAGVRRWTLVTSGRTRPPVVTCVNLTHSTYVAAVENGPLSATAFRPEKSGEAGAVLLAGWVKRL